MIRLIVSLLLLVMSVGGFAADEEIIRLKDGRVLHGVYDEAAGTIAIAGPDGKSSAIIRITTADIVSRTSLEAKVPDRNFIQEAAELDRRMQAEKVARAAREQEQLDADRKASVEADRLFAERQSRQRQQLADDLAERERQSAQAAARAKSEAEAEAQRIALMRDLATLRAIEQKEIDRAQAGKAAAVQAAEQRQAEIARIKQEEEGRASIARINRELEASAAERSQKRQREILITVGYIALAVIAIVVAFLLWFWPYRIAKRRHFTKARDVQLVLIICIFLPGINLLGWLATMMWVLIATQPDDERQPAPKP